MPIRSARTALLILALASGASGLDAQATLLPGDASIHPDRLRDGATAYRWVMVREGNEVPMATLSDVLTRVALDGEPALLRVVSVQRGPGTLVDSTYTRLSDLAPLRHRSHQPGRTVVLDFSRSAVHGAITPALGEARAIQESYDAPFFDSGNWDLVIRAMTLAAGEAVSIPVYDADHGGRIAYQARVTGLEAYEGGQAWRVEASLGQTRATLWIDPDTRAVHAMEMEVGPGMRLRQLPVR